MMPAMAPVVRPMRGAVRVMVGLMVVVQSRWWAMSVTVMIARVVPQSAAMVPVMAASRVICRAMWERLAPSARRSPISGRRSMVLRRVALAMAMLDCDLESACRDCERSAEPVIDAHRNPR